MRRECLLGRTSAFGDQQITNLSPFTSPSQQANARSRAAAKVFFYWRNLRTKSRMKQPSGDDHQLLGILEQPSAIQTLILVRVGRKIPLLGLVCSQ